ncbi:MAG: recombinase family protein [Chloroflexi bacterium]|nr:recombinase family protein [Chloroflexota bacterium]
MNKRAVLYARVSYDDRENDGLNLAGQLEMCRKYAQDRGYSIMGELAEDDRGVSGVLFELPQLNRTLDMARAGDYDVLVTREIDRFARSLAKQFVAEQELKRAGVDIEYALAEYPDTPEGRLNKHIKATIAEYEREKINERMTRGRRQKVRAGHVVACGRTAYGYRPAVVDGKQTLIIYESEARIVRLIYEWYTGYSAEGRLSNRTIARRLYGMHVPTWGDLHPGKTNRKCGPCEWSGMAIRSIIINETYAGVWRFGGMEVQVPAIVSREVWAAAQDRRAENKRKSKRNRKYHYLLAGHVRCGKCHKAMSGTTLKPNGVIYQYYACTTKERQRGFDPMCDMPYFRVVLVDMLVWDWLYEHLTNPAKLTEGLKAEQEERDRVTAPLRERLTVMDELLTSNRQQLAKLLDLYLAGDFSRDLLAERKTRLETTIAALEREREELAAHIEAQALTADQIQTIRDFAAAISEGLKHADADFEFRRRLIDRIDMQVTLWVEDEVKMIEVYCVVGKGTLLANKGVSCDSSPGRNRRPGPSDPAGPDPARAPRR